MAENSASYRPEIDGLRAVAVSTVIANHFSHSLLPGGFLGVDIFFVISGYVITRSLMAQPVVSMLDLLLGFYERRVRRIVPALVVCVLVTALVGALFLNPFSPEYVRSMRGGIYALLGFSNIYFFKEETDYFGGATQLNLFTHTWSLGVEEQFYLIYPPIFWAGAIASEKLLGRAFFLVGLSSVTALSLMAYFWLSARSAPGVYFMMPLRFWELCIGCLVATSRIDKRQFGLIAIWPWVAASLLTASLIAPSSLQVYSTPMAVFATGVLLATLRSGHPIWRFLMMRWMVALGLISYSLYLWHWSVLSISRWTIGVDLWTAPLQIVAMLSISVISYTLIERPLRRRKWSRTRVGTIAVAATVVACSVGALSILKGVMAGVIYTGTSVEMKAKGVESLLANRVSDGRIQWSARSCILSSDDDAGKAIDLEQCTFGLARGAGRQFLVVGNSFSAAELEMVAALADGHYGAVTVISSWGASPVPELPNTSPWSKANAYYWAPRKIAAFLNLCESDCHNRIRGYGYDGSIRFF
jgi:peptidoglycan/LPS O-acetylase OafA/YrhL